MYQLFSLNEWNILVRRIESLSFTSDHIISSMILSGGNTTSRTYEMEIRASRYITNENPLWYGTPRKCVNFYSNATIRDVLDMVKPRRRSGNISSTTRKWKLEFCIKIRIDELMFFNSWQFSESPLAMTLFKLRLWIIIRVLRIEVQSFANLAIADKWQHNKDRDQSFPLNRFSIISVYHLVDSIGQVRYIVLCSICSHHAINEFLPN